MLLAISSSPNTAIFSYSSSNCLSSRAFLSLSSVVFRSSLSVSPRSVAIALDIISLSVNVLTCSNCLSVIIIAFSLSIIVYANVRIFVSRRPYSIKARIWDRGQVVRLVRPYRDPSFRGRGRCLRFPIHRRHPRMTRLSSGGDVFCANCSFYSKKGVILGVNICIY